MASGNLLLQMVDTAVVVKACASIGELFVSLLIGIAAAKHGLLSNDSIKSLNGIIYHVLLPCLALTSVISALKTMTRSTLAMLPIYAIFQIAPGLLVGELLYRVLQGDSEMDRRMVIVCCAFHNSSTIPTFLATALFDCTKDNGAEFLASAALYNIGWSALFWTVGFNLLTTGPQYSTLPSGQVSNGITLSWKKIFTPPMIASNIGLAIGLVPSFESFVLKEGTPVNVVFKSMESLGVAFAPIAILVLAGSMANVPQEPQGHGHGPVDKREDMMRFAKVVIAICFTRFFLYPLTTLAFLVGERTQHLVGDDPVIKFTLLIESVMPTAQTIPLMLQLEDKDYAASRCARILMVVYIIAFIPVSLVTSIGLKLFFPE